MQLQPRRVLLGVVRAPVQMITQYGVQALKDPCRGRDINVIFREVDPRLQQRDQITKLLLDRREAIRERPFRLLQGYAGLIQGCRLDQIVDCFRLRKIDATVQEGSLRELTGLGKARPEVDLSPRRGCPQVIRSPEAARTFPSPRSLEVAKG